MIFKKIDFDDYRCRNLFVHLLKQDLPGAKVYHKSHTSYGKVYLELPEDSGAEGTLSDVLTEYQEQRKKMLAEVGEFLEKMLENTKVEDEDLSGDDFVKVNFPSPYSFLFLRQILERKGIELKDHFTSSTAIIGVYDEGEFNDKVWKGKFKPLIERLENKITYLTKPYTEE